MWTDTETAIGSRKLYWYQHFLVSITEITENISLPSPSPPPLIDGVAGGTVPCDGLPDGSLRIVHQHRLHPRQGGLQAVAPQNSQLHLGHPGEDAAIEPHLTYQITKYANQKFMLFCREAIFVVNLRTFLVYF